MNFFRKRTIKKDISTHIYEFCPRCEANLTLQKGYHADLPYWVCKGCGEMLINPRVDTDSDIAWICDNCESMMNEQPGFTEDCGQWKCTECGFVNRIDNSTLYESEAEYQMDLCNPYKGMTDEDVISIMSYEELDCINGKENIIMVRGEEGKLYVKKILSIYDESVYRHLMEQPVSHMPKIIEVYKGDSYLVVIEEYIEGRTLSDVIKEHTIEPARSFQIAREICTILKELHSMKCPIIHRDIKPSNVMINESGEVFLLDVNVAKWVSTEAKEDTRLLGTLYYAAPEQLGYGFSASTEKTDIYAIGVLLNVMITGKLPKEEQAPAALWKVIEKCICLEADERYSDDELLAVLNDYLR